jgi:hypothetical protein
MDVAVRQGKAHSGWGWIDTSCGWARLTMGERYGSVSLKARTDAISRLPWVSL